MFDEKDIDISRYIPLDMGLQCVEVKYNDKLIIALTKFDNSKEIGVEYFALDSVSKFSKEDLDGLVEKGKQMFH